MGRVWVFLPWGGRKSHEKQFFPEMILDRDGMKNTELCMWGIPRFSCGGRLFLIWETGPALNREQGYTPVPACARTKDGLKQWAAHSEECSGVASGLRQSGTNKQTHKYGSYRIRGGFLAVPAWVGFWFSVVANITAPLWGSAACISFDHSLNIFGFLDCLWDKTSYSKTSPWAQESWFIDSFFRPNNDCN